MAENNDLWAVYDKPVQTPQVGRMILVDEHEYSMLQSENTLLKTTMISLIKVMNVVVKIQQIPFIADLMRGISDLIPKTEGAPPPKVYKILAFLASKGSKGYAAFENGDFKVINEYYEMLINDNTIVETATNLNKMNELFANNAVNQDIAEMQANFINIQKNIADDSTTDYTIVE